MDNFLDSIVVPSIDPRLNEELEKPIQLEELTSCLKLIQNNKASGPNGFPVDFIYIYI